MKCPTWLGTNSFPFSLLVLLVRLSLSTEQLAPKAELSVGCVLRDVSGVLFSLDPGWFAGVLDSSSRRLESWQQRRWEAAFSCFRWV